MDDFLYAQSVPLRPLYSEVLNRKRSIFIMLRINRRFVEEGLSDLQPNLFGADPTLLGFFVSFPSAVPERDLVANRRLFSVWTG